MSNIIYKAPLFKERLVGNGISLSTAQVNLLIQYVDLLCAWNKKINIISRKDEENIWNRHILASIAILFNHRFAENTRIADIGTGGGLPGIPLAILHEKINFILIDSIKKKAIATLDIVSQLQLKNTAVILGRAENLPREKKFQHAFDYITARAVAPAEKLIDWAKPLLKECAAGEASENVSHELVLTLPRPALIMFKGGNIEGELEAAKKKHNPKSLTVHPIVVKGLEDSDDLYDKKIVIVQP